MHFVGLPAVQAKTKLAGDKPVVATATALPALGADLNVFWLVLTVGAFDLGLGLGQVKPGFGQVFDAATVGLARSGRTQKTIAGVFVVISRYVVDLARGIFHLRLARAPHRVVLLPAIATEMHGVELRALFLAPRRVALGIQGDVAHALRLERGQHFAWATDELMQLEGEGGATLGCFDVVRSHQETLQPGARLFQRALRIVSQAPGSIAQRNGPGPPGWFINGQFNAQAQLDPDSQGVVAEGGEVWPLVTFFQQRWLQK